jgi:hypothetical protein
MSTSSLGGLWTYPSITFQGHDDFMFIDEDRRRIISFTVFAEDPLKRAAIRLWFRSESPTSISVRLRATEEWRVHEFQLDGDRISWTFGGAVQPWCRVPCEERPDWLDALLTTENAKMDAASE